MNATNGERPMNDNEGQNIATVTLSETTLAVLAVAVAAANVLAVLAAAKFAVRCARRRQRRAA